MNIEGRMTGFEPANDGTTTHCRNHLATLAYYAMKYTNFYEYFL